MFFLKKYGKLATHIKIGVKRKLFKMWCLVAVVEVNYSEVVVLVTVTGSEVFVVPVTAAVVVIAIVLVVVVVLLLLLFVRLQSLRRVGGV